MACFQSELHQKVLLFTGITANQCLFILFPSQVHVMCRSIYDFPEHNCIHCHLLFFTSCAPPPPPPPPQQSFVSLPSDVTAAVQCFRKTDSNSGIYFRKEQLEPANLNVFLCVLPPQAKAEQRRDVTPPFNVLQPSFLPKSYNSWWWFFCETWKAAPVFSARFPVWRRCHASDVQPQPGPAETPEVTIQE